MNTLFCGLMIKPTALCMMFLIILLNAQFKRELPEVQPADEDSIPVEADVGYDADDAVARLLGSLTIHSDDRVSISIPEAPLPGEGGKDELVISLSATYSDEPGSYSVVRLLDQKGGWCGSENPSFGLSPDKGELISVSLYAKYLTKPDEGGIELLADGSNEATAPFIYDAPIGYTSPGSEIAQTDDSVTIRYTLVDGTTHALSFAAVSGIELAANDTFAQRLVKKSENVGSVTLYGLGTNDKQALEMIDPSADSLPMQIFAPTALSNHADYADYRVISHSPTGAVARAEYRVQLLGGDAPAAVAPWESRDCILVYDYEKLPYYAEILIDKGILSDSELEALAASVSLE